MKKMNDIIDKIFGPAPSFSYHMDNVIKDLNEFKEKIEKVNDIKKKDG